MARTRAVRVLAVLGSIVAGAEAWALAPSEARCVAAKARASAKVVQRIAACHAKNVLAGGTFGPECFARAAIRLADELERADRVGPCGGDHRYLSELARTRCLRVPNVFDRCNAAKIRAAGELAAGLLRCLGRNGGILDPECAARRNERFLADIARAERFGPCPGDAAFFGEPVGECIDEFALALGCGNGRIDRGEECDGQIFCTTRECRIVVEISCCQFGTPPMAVCADVFPEICFASGFQVAPGFCAGEPVPEFCEGCKFGGCEDPPIPPTSVCCEQAASCQATTVATTVGLMNELHQCRLSGGQPFIGTCGPGGACVP